MRLQLFTTQMELFIQFCHPYMSSLCNQCTQKPRYSDTGFVKVLGYLTLQGVFSNQIQTEEGALNDYYFKHALFNIGTIFMFYYCDLLSKPWYYLAVSGKTVSLIDFSQLYTHTHTHICLYIYIYSIDSYIHTLIFPESKRTANGKILREWKSSRGSIK